MPRKSTKTSKIKTVNSSYLDKVEAEVQTNQSKFNLALGGLIILVVGLLLFNYFNKDKAEIGPSQQTQNRQSTDVTPENLPGKYTVKEGDTLFTISDKYYLDGYRYTEIAKANKIEDPDILETGQVLDLPKLSTKQTETAETTPQPTPTGTTLVNSQALEWGSVISGNSYTVAQGDWLSTIAARAYSGDIMGYSKIAQANNIQNPDIIEPGTVLTIPR